MRKLHVYLINEDYSSFEKLTKQTFGLILSCHLDQLTEKIIAELIRGVELPAADFIKLQNHIRQSEKPISDILAKVVVLQFLHKGTLFADGKSLFSAIEKKNIFDFITAVENKNYEQAIAFLEGDPLFSIYFALAIREPADLRRKIMESLPDDGSVQKEKLFLVLYHEEGNLDKAFEILQKMDLSKLGYAECLPTLRIAQEKKAWDFAVVLLL